MKKRIGFFSMLFLCIVFISTIKAAPLPGGTTQVALIENYKLKVGLQSHVTWDQSNIPLSGVSTFTDTVNYNFFRQRMRFNIDLQPARNAGGFMQLEYRGGWGGSSPAADDPRGQDLSLNANNRLKARGVRYGYIYYTPDDGKTYLSAGILPLTDQLGQTLFSANRDFNVGGICTTRQAGQADFRLAFVRLVDGVSSYDKDTVRKDGDFYLADANYHLTGTAKLGGHVYFLNIPKEITVETHGISGKISQIWYAVSGSVDFDLLQMNAFLCVNKGQYGDNSNTGWAGRTELIVPLRTMVWKLQIVHASGDEQGKAPNSQFRTVAGIVGTGVNWGYTHIFTGTITDSNVNNLELGIDGGGRGMTNGRGRGLTSVQSNLGIPLAGKLNGELFGGWFQTSKANLDGHINMGTEAGVLVRCELEKYLHLDVGASVAFLGDFFEENNQVPDRLHRIFSRFQLSF